MLWYDDDKTEKILVNLLSNAFKFTPENGEICIHCEYINKPGTSDPEYLSLKISDTGIGIPSDRIDRIFDRFYQVDDSTRRETEGTGIGLALTKELVDIYRGEIKVESVEGRGTTFWLKLPVAKELFNEDEISAIGVEKEEQVLGEQSPETGPEPKIPSAKGPDNSKPIILVVEDNKDLRTYISGTL